MDYEKLYKKALEKAKDYKEKGTIHRELEVGENIMEYIFPELKESEDEKIRKHIISVLEDAWQTCKTIDYDSSSIQEDIAWLKKQKVIPTEEDTQGREDVLWCIKQAKKYAKDENEMGTCWFAEKWLEKQGEKKSADEVLKIRQEVYQSGYNDGYKHGIEDVKQGEQEPIEWKDSDEKYLFWALLSIQKDIAASEINGVNTKDLNECVKWLYSLKQRMGG